MINTTTDKRKFKIIAFEIKDNDPALKHKQIQELINLHVPEEFRDLVIVEVDSYGFVKGTYIREETDEEYELRLEIEKERSNFDRQEDVKSFISIYNKYNLETLIPEDLRSSIIEAINYDEW
jgi:hypothetical protein